MPLQLLQLPFSLLAKLQRLVGNRLFGNRNEYFLCARYHIVYRSDAPFSCDDFSHAAIVLRHLGELTAPLEPSHRQRLSPASTRPHNVAVITLERRRHYARA